MCFVVGDETKACWRIRGVGGGLGDGGIHNVVGVSK